MILNASLKFKRCVILIVFPKIKVCVMCIMLHLLNRFFFTNIFGSTLNL